MLAVMGAPGGSDLNPASLDGRNPLFGGPMRVQAPSVPHDGVVYATLENALSSDEERLLPMSASVTSEGHVSELRSLSGEDIDDEAVRDLILETLGRPPRTRAVRRRSRCRQLHLGRRAHHRQGKDVGPTFRSGTPGPRTPAYFFVSTTAVETLFIASVARMITLRPASLSSNPSSKSSRRESGMPSFGWRMRQRLASSEYSTR